MSREVIESELRLFRHNVKQLMYFEDKLHEVALLLEGDSIKSPPIVSKDESKYQKGTFIYKNQITSLMLQEEQLIKEREYYLTAVNKVAKYLQLLDPEEVDIVECRHYEKLKVIEVAVKLNYDERQVYRKLDKIFEKLKDVMF